MFQTGGVCFQDPDDFEIQQVLDYDVDVVSLYETCLQLLMMYMYLVGDCYGSIYMYLEISHRIYEGYHAKQLL